MFKQNVLFYDSGTSLFFRLESGQLGITVIPGPELVNNTYGLLGTYDNNAQNDFTLPSGVVLPADIGADKIYSTFGAACEILLNLQLFYISTVYMCFIFK